MGIETLVGAGLGLLGSSQQADAAGDAAASQAEAARIAADAAAFRPVGLTTRFGKSGYSYDPEGRLVGAGYELAPDLAAMREGMMGLAGGSLYQAQQMRQLQPYIDESATNLFKLGTNLLPKDLNYQASPESQQYAQMLRSQSAASMPLDYSGRAAPEAQGLYNQLSGMGNKIMPTNYDPTARAQQVMQQQQALLAPGREQELAKVRNSLQQSGRAGLAMGATEAGRLAATNPEMAAYYNAMAQQDAQLAAGAQSQARGELQQDINLAQGLGTTGLNTLQQSQQQQLQNSLTRGQYATGMMGTALNAQQQAEQYARNNMLSNINTGAGLLGTGMNTVSQGYGLQTASLQPWQQYMQAAQGIEGMGINAMDLSTALGAKSSTAGANQANYLSRTGTPYTGSAIGSGLMGLANNQQFTNALSGMSNMSYTQQPGFTNTPNYLVR